MLEKLSPQEQVAGQIYSLNKAVASELSKVHSANVIDCPYEAFCDNPSKIYDLLKTKLGLAEDAAAYSGPEKFDVAGFDDRYGNETEFESIYAETAKLVDDFQPD
mgnify:CR=1 FL=1